MYVHMASVRKILPLIKFMLCERAIVKLVMYILLYYYEAFKFIRRAGLPMQRRWRWQCLHPFNHHLYYRLHTSFSVPNLLHPSLKFSCSARICECRLFYLPLSCPRTHMSHTSTPISAVMCIFAGWLALLLITMGHSHCASIPISSCVTNFFFGYGIVIKLKTFNIRHSVMICI